MNDNQNRLPSKSCQFWANQWHDIITLDESWIYLFSEHDLMWMDYGEIVVDREQHTVQSPKFMLTVVWNSIGFHVPCSENPPEGAQIQGE
jgi:hypothetical protein